MQGIAFMLTMLIAQCAYTVGTLKWLKLWNEKKVQARKICKIALAQIY
jgi:hypothetical protein